MSSEITERVTLTWDQVVALYVTLNEYHQQTKEQQEEALRQGFLGDGTHASIALHVRRPPLPRCPVCALVSRVFSQRMDRITFGEEYGFQPCGHVVFIAEDDLRRLWDRTQYRPRWGRPVLGECACRSARCEGCWLGSDLDRPDPLSDRSDR